MTLPKRRRLVLVLLVLAAAGALTAAIAGRPVAVAVARPETAAVPLQVFGIGSVEARVLAPVGFPLGGTVVELGADAGDRVAAGQRLARLDDGEPQARLARADALVARADADRRRADANLARARAIEARAAQVHERRQALLKRATVSVEAAEDAAAELAVAVAASRVAEGELAIARAALRDAEAQRELEAVLLERHALSAPFDAVVVERRKERGAVTAAGEPVFVLVDPDSVWLRLHIDEARAGGLAVGQPTEISLRSQPGRTYQGRVARIEIENDRVGEERRVHVACGDCPSEFHLGEQAEAVIAVGSLQRALMAPLAAVAEYDGAAGLVWTLEDGVLARRRVALGGRTLDGRVAVTGGLPDGAQLVVSPGGGLRQGARARAAAP